MAEQPSNPRGKGPKIQAEEVTEAKLCAYLEDALPPAERAEIEQYLAKNPQHRKLLSELATTRQWLIALPKQPAPPDIAESFQQQMERSMLLDDVDGGAATAPLSRWPQRLLIAALVLLAAGLGLVVYLALPAANGPTPQKLAANVPAPVPAPPAASPAPLPAATPPAMQAQGPAVRQPATQPSPPMIAMDNTKAAMPTAPPATQPAAGAAEMSASPPAGAGPVAVAAPPPAEALASASTSKMLTASTTQPAAVSQSVQRFLESNEVVYQQLDLNGENAVPQPPQFANVAPANNNGQPGVMQRSATQQVVTGVTPLQDQHVTMVQSQMSDADKAMLRSQQGQNFSTAFVVKQVPANFAAQLKLALQQQFPQDTISIAEQLAAPATAPSEASGETSSVVARGELLTVTVDQLTGPGVDKVNTLRVSDDGTITLPMMIEPLPVAGKTTQELEQAIAQRYRDGNLIPAATVHVAAATQPTTQVAAATSQPALTESNASTQPATTLNGDLLVLVEQASPPASQPATTAPASP